MGCQIHLLLLMQSICVGNTTTHLRRLHLFIDSLGAHWQPLTYRLYFLKVQYVKMFVRNKYSKIISIMCSTRYLLKQAC